MKYYLYIFLVYFSLISCQGNAQTFNKETDLLLVKTYEKYVENEYDYEGRETILKRFKSELTTALKDKQLQKYYFSEWDKKQAISVSKDSLLTILSWDWENNGSFHKYESMYRFVKGDKIYTHFLYEDQSGLESSMAAIYYEIYQLPDMSYLVKGWGTLGGGKDFFIFRKLTLKEEKLQDCVGCFADKNYFFFEKGRQDELDANYNEDTKSISYPELVPHLLDGEETGFYKPTGKILKMKYKNGMFLSTDQ